MFDQYPPFGANLRNRWNFNGYVRYKSTIYRVWNERVATLRSRFLPFLYTHGGTGYGSLPTIKKIKKRVNVNHVCVWWVVGMVCVPTIYHRHTMLPRTTTTIPLPRGRCYHIRLTDTLSVSSYHIC